MNPFNENGCTWEPLGVVSRRGDPIRGWLAADWPESDQSSVGKPTSVDRAKRSRSLTSYPQLTEY